MSNEVILLSDIPNQTEETYAARYAGPYVIKSKLNSAGINTILLDWFCFIRDSKKFLEYFENFIDENTKIIGISTTFLHPPRHGNKLNSAASVSPQASVELDEEDQTSNMIKTKELAKESVIRQALYLWHDSEHEMTLWFRGLRELLDKYNPNAKIILGGARIPTILHQTELVDENFALCKYVDYAFMGMADDAIVRFAKLLKQNKKIEVTKTKKGINYIYCDRDPWKSAHALPGPINYQKQDCFEKSHWAGLEIGRGCAFNCKFCYYEKRFSNKKDLQDLSEELKKNYYDFGIQGYNITADCFNDNRRFVGAWAEMTAKLPFKIEWASYVRIDPFHKWPEMMDEMIASGYRAGFFGIETLSHAAGKAAGKGLDPERVKELIALLKSKGETWFTAYMILGLPKETHESLQLTLDWFLEQRVIDEVQTSVLDIGPFIEDLAGVIDFSDHAKNPQKYGFSKVEFEPEFYWEHDTMNLPDALKIDQIWKEAFKDHPFTRFGGSAHGEYVRIRDLGLNHREAVVYMKTKFRGGKNIINIDDKKKKAFKNYVIDLSKQNIERYYRNFLDINRVRYAESNSVYSS